MTPRYNLRTLLLLLAILPPVLAVGWWRYQSWLAERAERERRSLKITWMIGPTVNPAELSQLPPWIAELEVPTYAGIDGALSSPRRPAEPPRRP